MTTTQNDMQSSPAPAPTSRRTNAIGRWMLNNGALVGLILLCIGLFIATPHFLTVPNLINVGIQSATIAILAFGMTFVIVTAGIDLSVGSIAALGAMTSAYFFAEVGLQDGSLCSSGCSSACSPVPSPVCPSPTASSPRSSPPWP